MPNAAGAHNSGVTRLLMPGALIPSVSALEANQAGGQSGGLSAGANVMTVNFTPDERRTDYLIYGVNRYVVKLQHVSDLLRRNGLRMSNSLWVPGSHPPLRATKGEANESDDCYLAS